MLAGVGVNAFKPAPLQAGNPVVDRVKFTIKTAGSTVSMVVFVAAAIFTALLSLATAFQITGFENARTWAWKNAQDSAFEFKAHGYGIISPTGAEQMLADAAAAVAAAQPSAVPAQMQGLLKRVIEAADECLFKSILQSNEKGQIFKAAVAAMIGLSSLAGGIDGISGAILAVMPAIGLRNLGWQGTAMALGLAYNPAFPKLAWETTKGVAEGIQVLSGYASDAATQIGDGIKVLRGVPAGGGAPVPGDEVPPVLPPELTWVAWCASMALSPFNYGVSLAASGLGHGVAGLANNVWFPLVAEAFKAVTRQPALIGAIALDGVIYQAGFKSAQWWRPHRLIMKAVGTVITAPFAIPWMLVRQYGPGGRKATDYISDSFNRVFGEGWGEELAVDGKKYRSRVVEEDVVDVMSGQKRMGLNGKPLTKKVVEWQVLLTGEWVKSNPPKGQNGGDSEKTKLNDRQLIELLQNRGAGSGPVYRRRLGPLMRSQSGIN